ncbi:MAG: FAD:protein FMN transferase [Spirochaetales bacterium]|nr:FAD:protein FMN transferase [Spirochaetales bacterium]
MEPVSSTEILLGTSCFITIYDMEKPAGASNALSEAFSRVSEMEQRLSMNITDSEISVINRDGQGPLSQDSLEVIKRSMEISDESDGRFDFTIGTLVSLWGIGSRGTHIPTEQEIADALATVEHSAVELNGNTLILEREGTQVDLGAIAKGHAADLAKEELLEQGVTSAIINLGGNVQLLGSKPDGTPWRIGIQDPRDSRGQYIAVLTTEDTAVVTSGIYERYFEEGGIHYHHILDPDTGYPVWNGVESLTIVTTDSITADGLSTALFAMGREAALEYAAAHDSVDVIVVDDQSNVYLSDGIRDSFRMTDPDFHLIEE